MHAMILAAGKGERMRPLTDTTPKPLLNVQGKSLLQHRLLALKSAGIKDVVINIYHHAQQIVDHIGDGAQLGLNVTYSAETELLNTGGGIVNALPKLGDQPFLVMSADIFTDFPLETLPINPTGLAHLVMVDNPVYNAAGDFNLDRGVLYLKGTEMYTYANIGVFRKEFFVHAPHGAFGLGDLIRKHIVAGLISGQYYAGEWHNVGTPEDLKKVNLIHDNLG